MISFSPIACTRRRQRAAAAWAAGRRPGVPGRPITETPGPRTACEAAIARDAKDWAETEAGLRTFGFSTR